MKPWIARALLTLMVVLLVAGAIALFLPIADCPGSTLLLPPILSEKMRKQHESLACPDCVGSGRITPWGRLPLQPQTSFPHDQQFLAFFRARASPVEVQVFESLRSSALHEDRDRALEMVLLSLSDVEIEAIGIHVGTNSSGMWELAYSCDDVQSSGAIDRALGLAKVHQHWGGVAIDSNKRWSVSKRDFVRARRALLEDREVQVQGVVVYSPRLSLGP